MGQGLLLRFRRSANR
ncbi:unnamed protein product [Rhodiola kirilowii]